MWSRSAPCLVFDEDAVRGALRDLGPTSDGAEAGAIATAANLPLTLTLILTLTPTLTPTLTLTLQP